MIKILAQTDRGRRRAQNQDCYISHVIAPDCAYAAVCDGMGGENGGQLASTLACQEIERIVSQALRPTMEVSELLLLLETAVLGANARVYEESRQNTHLEGMGTTVVMVLQVGDAIAYAHVGDSRLYKINCQGIQRLTTDHSVVQVLLDRGEITLEEAKTHSERHLITRAVGIEKIISPSFGSQILRPDDILLLCSDGLYNMVNEDTICLLVPDVLHKQDAGVLIEKANAAGGGDNITAIVMYQGLQEGN